MISLRSALVALTWLLATASVVHSDAENSSTPTTITTTTTTDVTTTDATIVDATATAAKVAEVAALDVGVMLNVSGPDEEAKGVAPKPQIDVIRLNLSQTDMEELLKLEQQIANATGLESAEGGADVHILKGQGTSATLTDEEIAEIIKSISFPTDDDDDGDGDGDGDGDTDGDHTKDTEMPDGDEGSMESRSGKASKGSRSYVIIAFSPTGADGAEDKGALPFTKLSILPATPYNEAPVPAAERRADFGPDEEEPRLISKHTWTKYLKILMRQLRKGTRKIKRKAVKKHHKHKWF